MKIFLQAVLVVVDAVITGMILEKAKSKKWIAAVVFLVIAVLGECIILNLEKNPEDPGVPGVTATAYVSTPTPTPTPTATPTPKPNSMVVGIYDNDRYFYEASNCSNKISLQDTGCSSYLTNSYGTFTCDRAFDGSTKTDWVEGSPKKQLGDWVSATWKLKDAYRYDYAAVGISIYGGMQYNGSTSWNNNDRPRLITITVNGHSFENIELKDTMSEQKVYFDGYAIFPDFDGTFDVKVTINSCYGGPEADATEYAIAISDIDLLIMDLNN